MSDYITFEIQEEIIKRLPVKSLIQFRSVSKAWKGLIDSPQFIVAYSLSHAHPHHLLIRYESRVGVERQYVSIVDNDTFPQQKFAPTVPLSIKLLRHSLVVGSSSGLLCLYGFCPHPDVPGPNCEKEMAVVWNPSIRKSVAIDMPDLSYGTVLGFGVSPVTSDPTIVKFDNFNQLWETKTKMKKLIPCKVRVYTLSSGEWKTPSCNLPGPSIEVSWSQAVIDRFIYWLAFNKIAINDRRQTSYTIMSFDMTIEEFREVYLPDSLTHPTDNVNFSTVEVKISKVWESLAVLEYNMDTNKSIYAVWMMEYGAPNSFTKLFTIKTPYASIMTLGFRKSGELIMGILDGLDDYYAQAALVAYEPYSEHINVLEISGRGCSFSVNSYMDTLLLLNQ